MVIINLNLKGVDLLSLPLGIEINELWLVLVASFVFVPILLIIFNRFGIVFIQMILIACVSGYLTYLNIQNIAMDSSDLNLIIIYGCIFLYLAVGLYALLESLYKVIVE